MPELGELRFNRREPRLAHACPTSLPLRLRRSSRPRSSGSSIYLPLSGIVATGDEIEATLRAPLKIAGRIGALALLLAQTLDHARQPLLRLGEVMVVSASCGEDEAGIDREDLDRAAPSTSSRRLPATIRFCAIFPVQ